MVKDLIQKYLYKKALKEYAQGVESQHDPYKEWCQKQNTPRGCFLSSSPKNKIHPRGVFCFSSKTGSSAPPADFIIFSDKRGQLDVSAVAEFEAAFAGNPELILVYAGEDVLWDGTSRIVRGEADTIYKTLPSQPIATLPVEAPKIKYHNRYKHWFKPDFSPDTLASFNYYGHVFAIRSSFLERYDKAEWEGFIENAGSRQCYEFLLRLTADIIKDTTAVKDTAVPIKEAASPLQKENLSQEAGNEIPGLISNIPGPLDFKAIRPIHKILFHASYKLEDMEGDYEENIMALIKECPEALQAEIKQQAEIKPQTDLSQVSVIIPSKDNPKVLETCISSLRNITQKGELPEIIVVDNGSTKDNKAEIEELSKKYNFKYIYDPAPFNFSKMCNRGAAAAKGSYLLFLNDDMEIIEPLWLKKLLFTASLPHVGCAGAKLLYPGTDLIQHVGVTNITVGPVHKIQKLSDKKSHYHGQNHHIYDMVGVTAACLLMKRENYNLIGGFKEEIAVSYNDVELCFSLIEAGFYNVFRGDAVLFHHESLSRGDDNMSEEKWQRLLEEKDRLYGFHPGMKNYDPFYSPALAGHSNIYMADFVWDFERRNNYKPVEPYSGNSPTAFIHEALTVNVEHARPERRLETTDRDDVYFIEGWSYVLNNDNARYRREMYLISDTGAVFKAGIWDRYREDVNKVMEGQINIALSGFVARFPKGPLTPGEYSIGILAMDKCSRQKLFALGDKKLVII